MAIISKVALKVASGSGKAKKFKTIPAGSDVSGLPSDEVKKLLDAGMAFKGVVEESSVSDDGSANGDQTSESTGGDDGRSGNPE